MSGELLLPTDAGVEIGATEAGTKHTKDSLTFFTTGAIGHMMGPFYEARTAHHTCRSSEH